MPVPSGPAQTELGAVVKMQVFPIHFNGVAGLGCGDCRVCSTDPAIRAVKLLHSQPEIPLKLCAIQVEFLNEDTCPCLVYLMYPASLSAKW